ncbi:N-acetylmuramoyl-L-alanine amidase [Aureimonas pseudogalii]|uniref:N-acetylmuramoyl-L-alanine amidase n=1 Tax=Aureimonas pseudogalii TaxID=1744844 RepID=A0A7W6H537_9HYPH|nr:N-acetylmuramoyl-L-alanine amidase [Aureimonas pseudogalii]MBB3998724.1 N-acetylmuramoyl-L-alanine amidase [Aureimonas pseudogalii]
MLSRLTSILLVLLSCLVSLPAAAASAATVVTDIRIEETDGGLTLALTTVGPADPRLVLLRKPYRVALDLADTVSAAKLPAAGRAGPLKSIRHGLVGPDRYRLMMELKGAMQPALSVERTETGATVRLALTPGTDLQFAMPKAASAANPSADPPGGAPRRDAPFVVVIDPGHGGIDRGATGEGGTEEKAVNLAFGLALRDELAGVSGVKVVLTRDDDTFIPLNERSAIARRAGANLFVSLHADSIRFKDLRGATVYTLSDRASDGLARELAESENSADRFAGREWDQDAPEIHDILVDLVRRETESFSEHFAVGLVTELRDGGIRLINNPKRSAGFRVLRAPDVPSILLEIGYLSNPEEEKLLKSGEWQKKVAHVLGRSIVEFARQHGAPVATQSR